MPLPGCPSLSFALGFAGTNCGSSLLHTALKQLSPVYFKMTCAMFWNQYWFHVSWWLHLWLVFLLCANSTAKQYALRFYQLPPLFVLQLLCNNLILSLPDSLTLLFFQIALIWGNIYPNRLFHHNKNKQSKNMWLHSSLGVCVGCHCSSIRLSWRPYVPVIYYCITTPKFISLKWWSFHHVSRWYESEICIGQRENWLSLLWKIWDLS